MSGNLPVSPNSSGFHSYPIASIYPNYGSGFTQTDDTIPEADEQAQYTSGDNSAPQVPANNSRGIWIFLLLVLLLVVVFGK